MERKTVSERKSKGGGMSEDTKRQLLHYMKLTREIEYRIERVLYRQGKIVGRLRGPRAGSDQCGDGNSYA